MCLQKGKISWVYAIRCGNLIFGFWAHMFTLDFGPISFYKKACLQLDLIFPITFSSFILSVCLTIFQQSLTTDDSLTVLWMLVTHSLVLKMSELEQQRKQLFEAIRKLPSDRLSMGEKVQISNMAKTLTDESVSLGWSVCNDATELVGFVRATIQGNSYSHSFVLYVHCVSHSLI